MAAAGRQAAARQPPGRESGSPVDAVARPSELGRLLSALGNGAIARMLGGADAREPMRVAHDALATPSRPLDAMTLRAMETQFGYDFSAVRVHDDAPAAATAAEIDAAAFTVGQDIVFGAGRYAPATAEGRELLAHELAHTIQQREAQSESPPVAPGSVLESQAEQAAHAVVGGSAPTHSLSPSGLAVARQAVGADDERSDDEIRRELAHVVQNLRLLEQRRRRFSDTAAGELRREREDPGFWDDLDRVSTRLATLTATLRRRAAIADLTAIATRPEEPEQEAQPAEVPMALPDEETTGSAPPPSPSRTAPASGRGQAGNARFLPGGFSDSEINKLVSESKDEVWQAIQAAERAEAERARKLDEMGPDPYVWGYVLNESGTSDRIRMRRSELEAAQDRARNRAVLASMESIGAGGPVTTAGLVVGGTARVMRGGESKEAVPSALALGGLGDAFALGPGAAPLTGGGAGPGPEPPGMIEKASPPEPMPEPGALEPMSRAPATGEPTSTGVREPAPGTAESSGEPLGSAMRAPGPATQPGQPAPRSPTPPRPPQAPMFSNADLRTAGTGGIESITQRVNASNQTVVIIEGRLLAPIANRSLNAPNFNKEKVWQTLRGEHGLPTWQAAHLWGPGFGDEAAAGIMLAPSDVNLIWQNQGVESFLRDLQEMAAVEGASVHVRAVAISQPRTIAGGAALAEVQYEFSIERANGPSVRVGRVGFTVDAPPNGKVSEPEVVLFH
jgi:Domain of unknown function (DUF4157)/Bacterial toxin 4